MRKYTAYVAGILIEGIPTAVVYALVALIFVVALAP